MENPSFLRAGTEMGDFDSIRSVGFGNFVQ
jgi:hypothetical protein